MKKTFSNIRFLAALLMVGAAFIACSSDDSIIEQQPITPDGQVYTLTVNATKDGSATTRALNLSGTNLVASWATTDVITVTKGTTPVGTLSPSNISGGNATFTGTVSEVVVGDVLTLDYHPITSLSAFGGQDGTLKDKTNSAENYDMATATVTVKTVESGNITIEETGASFKTQTAVLKLVLNDGTNAIDATSLNLKATITLPSPISAAITEDIFTFIPTAATYTANGSGILYFALPNATKVAADLAAKINTTYPTSFTSTEVETLLATAKLTFTASVGATTYTTTKTGYSFAAAKYYATTLTMENMNTIPLTLEAKAAGTITFENHASGKVTYKLNGGEGVDIAAGESKAIPVAAGGKVAFYGDNGSYAPESDYSNISCTASCIVYGNIMSLINSTAFANATTLTGVSAFYKLFEGNTNIDVDPSNPLVLPATTLTEDCYYGMFANCTGLTIAPALPATTLAECCYDEMFANCTGLTIAPALPATTLADYCYTDMFNGCSNLNTAPATLPATTLKTWCYYRMFRGCSRLNVAPTLSATTLATECCYEMFFGCSDLNTVPDKLPAMSLSDNCYEGMFYNCTSLTEAPSLPATTLAYECYSRMFINCTSLTVAPYLPAKILEEGCYKQMFNGCTNLSSISCAATDMDASSCTFFWIKDVAASGTFKKAASADWSGRASNSGIPSGWTVEILP